MELTNQSDGEQWFLRFYTKLATAEKLNKQFVWLMDEPGQSLHATSQINLKNYFESLSDNHQIIYTTHQPMMVPWQKLERIFVVENDVLRGTLIHQRFWKDEETESPLREALGLFVGEELLTGKEHIIVEGPSDYVYLQGWLSFFQRNRSGKLWREEYNLLERSFVPVQGKDTIPLYLLYLTKKTKGKINSIAIPDSKAAEDEVKKRLDGIDPLNKRVVSVSSLLSDIKIKDIEDLFEAKEFLTEVKEFYSKNYPEISFPTDFTEVKKSSLANGVINYVESKINFGVNLDGEPRGLDKVGSALNFYKKLSSDKKLPYSKETVKRFETVLKEVSKLLMTESSKT